MTKEAYHAFYSKKTALHEEGFPPLTSEQQHRFDELFHESYKKVYQLAYRLAANRVDAEDLTQEAFVRAYKNFQAYEGGKPFENWVYRIVTRLFLDMMRSKQRRVHTVSMDAPIWPDSESGSTLTIEVADGHEGPEEVLMNRAVSEKMEGSLAKLKSSQRILVFLADIEQLSYHDIAEIVGIPVGTVRSRLHRAHKQLKTSLE